MSFVRNLIADLVAKRLWPVAAALVVALVAVPFALKGGAEEPAPAPMATGGAPSADTAAVVSLAEDGPRGGKSTTGRNPFEQRDVAPESDQSVTAAADTAAASAAAGVDDVIAAAKDAVGSGSGGSSVPAASLPGLGDVTPVGGTSTGSTGGSTPKTTPKANSNESYSVDIRFGKDGVLKKQTDVARLSPLPSATSPFFVFLGVLADGKTAMFLVSSDAEVTGDGKCLPSADACERVEMKAGDTEFFDVTTPDGQAVQYQLELTRVSRETKANAAVAAAARVRESADGRKVLRHAVDSGQVEISDLAYSPQMGVVVPSGRDQDRAGSLFAGYRVDLQFGEPGTPLVKRYNLARLTPLPSVDSPSLLFMGVLSDGETVLFLNPTRAAASGDAVCSPTPEQCDRVSLKAGQTAMFDVATMDGQTTRYQLDIDAVSPVRMATQSAAFAYRMRESKAGRVVLRRLIHEVGSLVADLSFSPRTGAVVPADSPQAPKPEAGTPPTPGEEAQGADVAGSDED